MTTRAIATGRGCSRAPIRKFERWLLRCLAGGPLVALTLAACTSIDPAIPRQVVAPTGVLALNGTFSNVPVYFTKKRLNEDYARTLAGYLGLFDDGADSVMLAISQAGDLDIRFLRGADEPKSVVWRRGSEFEEKTPGVLQTTRNRWCLSDLSGIACRDTKTSIFVNAEGNVVVVVGAFQATRTGLLSVTTAGMAVYPRIR